MYTETNPRALHVLACALASGSKATRLRAVAMLSRVDCTSRSRWIQAAETDRDPGVRQMACIVSAWVCEVGDPPWPAREESAWDESAYELAGEHVELEIAAGVRYDWEYVVEVWRADGLPVGVFLAATCAEDDEHAKCIALGQAVLASASARGERFEPSEAAAFIIGKRRVRHAKDRSGEGSTSPT